MPQIVEVVRFRVSEPKAEAFVAQRPGVDAELEKLAGFAGSELVHVGGEEWLLLVYWQTRADVEAAQKVTETLPTITAWTQKADQFLSFNTSTIRHSTRK